MVNIKTDLNEEDDENEEDEDSNKKDENASNETSFTHLEDKNKEFTSAATGRGPKNIVVR